MSLSEPRYFRPGTELLGHSIYFERAVWIAHNLMTIWPCGFVNPIERGTSDQQSVLRAPPSKIMQRMERLSAVRRYIAAVDEASICQETVSVALRPSRKRVVDLVASRKHLRYMVYLRRSLNHHNKICCDYGVSSFSKQNSKHVTSTRHCSGAATAEVCSSHTNSICCSN